MSCEALIKSGLKKGEKCNCKTKQGNKYCGKHKNYDSNKNIEKKEQKENKINNETIGIAFEKAWCIVSDIECNHEEHRINYEYVNKFIPKMQMPPDAKKILIDVIGNIPKLSGGIIKDDFLNYYTQASRSVLVFKNIMYTFVEELVKDKNLMENMVQMWREGMATLTDRKPKQIEEIIRRFIKNL